MSDDLFSGSEFSTELFRGQLLEKDEEDNFSLFGGQLGDIQFPKFGLMKTSMDPVLSSTSGFTAAAAVNHDNEDEISRFLDCLATPPPSTEKSGGKPIWSQATIICSPKKEAAPKSAAVIVKKPAAIRQQVADSTQKSPTDISAPPTSAVKVKKLALNPREQQELFDFLGCGGNEKSCVNLRRSERRIPTESNTLPPPAAVSPPSRPLSPASTSSRFSRTEGTFAHSSSKQAEYARNYRRKNKDFVDELRGRIEDLQRENAFISEENGELKELVTDLKAEIGYLRGVLANDSEISSLVQGIQNTPGIKLRFPSQGNPKGSKRHLNDSDSGLNPASKNAKIGNVNREQKPGVCLHIRDEEVSVEFCGRCNRESRSDPIVAPRDLIRAYKFHHRNIETVENVLAEER